MKVCVHCKSPCLMHCHTDLASSRRERPILTCVHINPWTLPPSLYCEIAKVCSFLHSEHCDAYLSSLFCLSSVLLSTHAHAPRLCRGCVFSAASCPPRFLWPAPPLLASVYGRGMRHLVSLPRSLHPFSAAPSLPPCIAVCVGVLACLSWCLSAFFGRVYLSRSLSFPSLCICRSLWLLSGLALVFLCVSR
jgi:hypothetical protein